ncbi:unnamed protein product [Rhizoctonia solani]|uniref:Cyanovirin-N domain-containing protein n=1 Tax=Rhizoctonia solani TaxID=456999 RepID=A0A8H3B1I7_9AGAM|nr:unnamed protein product [Rhizoctonia solani]
MTFSATAEKDSISLCSKQILVARLLNDNGEWKAAAFDLDECIGNIDGKLVWGGRNYSCTTIGAWLFTITYSPDPPRPHLSATLKKDDGSEANDTIDLNQGIANVNGELKYRPVSEISPSSPPPAPADCTRPSSRQDDTRSCQCLRVPQCTRPPSQQNNTLPPEQAKGTLTALPPHNLLCTAFVAKFTEPNDRQLFFTACPIVAIPTFSAEVALHYGEVCEASGVRAFGGSASKAKLLLYLDNGVRIVGDVVHGKFDEEVTIAGSGHWVISR